MHLVFIHTQIAIWNTDQPTEHNKNSQIQRCWPIILGIWLILLSGSTDRVELNTLVDGRDVVVVRWIMVVNRTLDDILVGFVVGQAAEEWEGVILLMSLLEVERSVVGTSPTVVEYGTVTITKQIQALIQNRCGLCTHFLTTKRVILRKKLILQTLCHKSTTCFHKTMHSNSWYFVWMGSSNQRPTSVPHQTITSGFCNASLVKMSWQG